jgi:two-component system, response regulator
MVPRIVFVDDDPDDRELIVDCLLHNHISSYRIFDSGTTLFTYLKTLQAHELPEVIVLDLNMPAMDGLEVLTKLKAVEPYQHIPVYLLTTSSRSQLIEQCLRVGADGYYQKPNSLSDYKTIVKKLKELAFDA